MRVTSVIAIYFVVWFLVLFAVLPFGVRTQDDEGGAVLGTPASAPAAPRLLRVAAITTVVAAVVVGAFYYLYVVLGVDTDYLAHTFGW